MTTYTFTGTDGDPLPAGLTERNGTFEIQSNKAVASGSSPGGALWVCTATATADGTFAARINGGGSSAANLAGVIFRYSGLNNMWWAGISQADGELHLVRRQAGANVVEETYTVPSYNNAADYAISVTTSGNDISVSLDGVERITHTNSFSAPNSTAGLRHSSTGQSTDVFAINEPLPAAESSGRDSKISLSLGISL